MKLQILPIIAIIASLVAIMIAFFVDAGSPSEEQVTLGILERRLSSLESRIGLIGRPDQKLSGLITRTDARGSADSSVDGVRKKQEELEAQLSELGVIEHFKEQQRMVDESRAVVLDHQAGSKQRLGALAVLRKAERIDNEVVTAMVTLWEDSLSDEGGD